VNSLNFLTAIVVNIVEVTAHLKRIKKYMTKNNAFIFRQRQLIFLLMRRHMQQLV